MYLIILLRTIYINLKTVHILQGRLLNIISHMESVDKIYVDSIPRKPVTGELYPGNDENTIHNLLCIAVLSTKVCVYGYL